MAYKIPKDLQLLQQADGDFLGFLSKKTGLPVTLMSTLLTQLTLDPQQQLGVPVHEPNQYRPRLKQHTHPNYLVTTKILISSTKETVVFSQFDESRMCPLVNPTFTKVGLLFINAKDLQCLISKGVNKLTPKLSDACKILKTINQSTRCCRDSR